MSQPQSLDLDAALTLAVRYLGDEGTLADLLGVAESEVRDWHEGRAVPPRPLAHAVAALARIASSTH